MSPPEDQEQSRALLASIVDHSDDVIISMTLDGTITSWNHTAESTLGYTSQEAIGQSIMMILPPDRIDEEPEFLRRIKAGDHIRHYETIRRAKSGDYVDLSLTISPIIASNGKIIGASKIARNIGTERQARERLRQSEEWFRVTLSSIGDAVIATDGIGRITFMNRVAERLTGWAVQEAITQPLEKVFKVVNEFSREPVENPVAKVIRLGTIVGLANHTVLIARDGTERPIDDSGAPIRGIGPDLNGVVLVFRDASAQRAAEVTSLKMAAIVENSDDAIISKDLRGIIQTWNQGAEKIFGYTSEEIVGKSITTLIPPELQSQEEDILSRLKRGERLFHFETTRVAKDGRRIPVSLTISPVKDSEGRIIGASKIGRDIGERKIAEETVEKARMELETHARKLEETVRERTAILERTVAELETFSYSLSHDLRAPLRTIQSFLEIVMSDYADKMAPKGLGLLDTAMKTAARMDKLILDLLSFTRTSRAPLALETMDVKEVINRIIRERPQFQPERADIEVAGEIPSIQGNQSSLGQCVSNLLDNAVKFVPPGVKPCVRIHSENVGNMVRVWFEDNGIGIDDEGKKQLFQVFQRLHPKSYEGTGIGLAIVRKAMERMGGQTGVESNPGGGSRFWLKLQRTSP